MPINATTKLKRQINRRTKLLDESTKEVLESLSEVLAGAAIFFRTAMPQLNVNIVWSDVEMIDEDHIIIKGLIEGGDPTYQAANVMVIHIPLILAAEGTATEIGEYMIKKSGHKKQKTKAEPEAEASPSPRNQAEDFDLGKLSPQQRESLQMYNLSRGGKK